MDKTKFIIGIQARSTSTRFPEKCLRLIHGVPIWSCVYVQALITGISTSLLIPTTDQRMVDSITDFNPEVIIIFGPEESPLERYRLLIKFFNNFKAQYIIRITADCPLLTAWMILDMAHQFERDNCTFMYNELDGMDVQIADVSLFNHDIYLDKEHVFNMDKIKEHGIYTKWEMHTSIDTKEQYEHIKFLMGDES